jgi:hypothetical protein
MERTAFVIVVNINKRLCTIPTAVSRTENITIKLKIVGMGYFNMIVTNFHIQGNLYPAYAFSMHMLLFD